MDRDCKHGRLARSCNLCQAQEDINFEGYSAGFSNGNFDPPQIGLADNEYGNSDAKVNSESV